MPWKEVTEVNERMKFVVRLQEGERMSDLCQEFGISRKTGYKFLQRFEKFGASGLYDFSRRPKRLARQLSPGIQGTVLGLKKEHPTWGAAKIQEILRRKHPEMEIPVRSTIHDLLDRHGLVKKRSRRRRYHAYPSAKLEEVRLPNQLWCADFKGQFKTLDSRYCYPLTVTDQFSRYLLGCEALESTKCDGAQQGFELIFREYGLPDRIRTDNGVPFSSRSVQGLSRLNVWWMRLGIQLERIEPGKPQQNGRHERMHRTLKDEVTRPPARNLLQQQEKFDLFREQYNGIRPHEALQMKTPGEFYKRSSRVFPEYLPEPHYPQDHLVKMVSDCGKVHFQGKSDYFFLSEALGGQHVGLQEEEDGIWRVSFMDLDLGFLDADELKFTPISPEEQGQKITHPS